MQESNRETITEMSITIKVIAKDGRYDPIQIVGLADSITALALEDALGAPAIAGDHDRLAIARRVDTQPPFLVS